MSNLILVRHGQSVWNLENRFTGWVDIDLSKNGIQEARKSGELISSLNLNIDFYFTSCLKRFRPFAFLNIFIVNFYTN